MSDYNTVLVEARGAVTLVTLNRPQALNALNSEVLKELIEVFAAYDRDDGQRCLVLTGSGEKAFAAGADIKEMQPQGFADGPGEALRSAHARGHAELDLRLAELRAVRRDDEVGHHRDLAAASERIT